THGTSVPVTSPSGVKPFGGIGERTELAQTEVRNPTKRTRGWGLSGAPFILSPAMKTLIRFSLWAVAVAATAGTTLCATEPETGRVLVLDNERTLEGQIERVGDQYRIRRTIGETWLPANKALCVCGSREEAYQF